MEFDDGSDVDENPGFWEDVVDCEKEKGVVAGFSLLVLVFASAILFEAPSSALVASPVINEPVGPEKLNEKELGATGVTGVAALEFSPPNIEAAPEPAAGLISDMLDCDDAAIGATGAGAGNGVGTAGGKGAGVAVELGAGDGDGLLKRGKGSGGVGASVCANSLPLSVLPNENGEGDFAGTSPAIKFETGGAREDDVGC